MKRKWWLVAAALALLASPLAGQEDDRKFRPGGDAEEEPELTPEEAMRLLKETQELMERAEELLNDSSRGRALATEKDLVEKLEKLLGEKQDPAELQKEIMKKIDQLMKKARDKEEGATDKMAEIIRRVRIQMQKNRQQQQQQQKKEQEEKSPQSRTPQSPNNPAPRPYDPNRSTPPSKFRSRAEHSDNWGNLPPKLRDAMLHGQRDIDSYPPEFREALKEYMKRLAESVGE